MCSGTNRLMRGEARGLMDLGRILRVIENVPVKLPAEREPGRPSTPAQACLPWSGVTPRRYSSRHDDAAR